MRELLKVDLKLVRLSKSRPTDPKSVNAIAESMRASGLINPIIVKRGPVYDGAIMVSGYSVVAGNHRVSAARALGWTEIDAFVHEGDDLHAELVEIDENLQRAELTAAQRAAAIKRRKEIWEAMHPSGNTVPTPGGKQRVGFAADTAASAGMTKRSINEHVARAEALGDDINAVVGTSLDKGVELDALKSMSEVERKELIQRAKAGEKVSARGPKAESAPEIVKPDRIAELEAEVTSLREQLAEVAAQAAETLADNESMAKVFEADDRITAALAEAKKYREMNRLLEERIRGMQSELNAAIRTAKGYKARLERLEKAAA